MHLVTVNVKINHHVKGKNVPEGSIVRNVSKYICKSPLGYLPIN